MGCRGLRGNTLQENWRWWEANSDRLPLLTEEAARWLSVPSGSSAVERALSRMRATDTPLRQRLQEESFVLELVAAANPDLKAPWMKTD